MRLCVAITQFLFMKLPQLRYLLYCEWTLGSFQFGTITASVTRKILAHVLPWKKSFISVGYLQE